MSERKDLKKGSLEVRDVAKILDLLVRDLYGHDPQLTVRELIQNSHDAIMRLPKELVPEATINVRVQSLSADGYLEIFDNGEGMTDVDLEQHLSVVGDSSKLSDPSLIGKFGIGFLACFIVGNHVSVTTRKIGSDVTFIWETLDRKNWTIQPSDDHSFERGTRVRIYFGDEHPRLERAVLDELRVLSRLRRVVRRFGYLMPFPVFVGRTDDDDKVPVNARRPPWGDDDAAMESYGILAGADAEAEPVFVYPFDRRDPDSDAQVSGVLYFHDYILPASTMQVFGQRVLVDPDDRKLLPVYAPFVTGFVNSSRLKVDLSRRHTIPFDPNYQLIQETVRDEFTKAFERFSSRSPVALKETWPRVQGVTIPRLIEALFGNDRLDTDTATTFFQECVPLMPFRVLDSSLGINGQPRLMSLVELAESALSVSGKKPAIYYTDTTSLIEKNLLLTKQRKIIDVGSPDQSCVRDLLRVVQRMESKFSTFTVIKSDPTKFQSIGRTEVDSWEELTSLIQSGLNVPGRIHEVVVERFQPKSVPVMVTDIDIDERAIEQIRRTLAAGDIGDSHNLDRMFGGLLARGSTLVVHINADNENMCRLARMAAHDITASIVLATCWRAIVQHFGSSGGRQVMTRESSQYDNLVSSVVSLQEELLSLRDSEADAQDQLRSLGEELDEQRRRSAPVVEQTLDAIVGFVDIVDSTRKIINNPAGSPEERNRFIKAVVKHLAAVLSDVANVCGFTGDGLQFYIEKPNDSGSHRNVFRVLAKLPESLKDLCEMDPEVRELVKRTRMEPPQLRTATAFGQVYCGEVISSNDLIGLPAVEASRLCAKKEVFEKHRVHLLLTNEAYDTGAVWELWRATDFVPAEIVEFAGLENRSAQIHKIRVGD